MLLEQFEGDGRAERSAWGEESVRAYRERLDALLESDDEPETGRPVSRDEQELRRELGVA